MLPENIDISQVAPGKGWQNYSPDDIEAVSDELGAVANARQAAIMDVVWGCFHAWFRLDGYPGYKGASPVSEIARLTGMSKDDVWTEIVHMLDSQMNPDRRDEDGRVIEVDFMGKEDDNLSPRWALISRHVDWNAPDEEVYSKEEIACNRAGFELLR